MSKELSCGVIIADSKSVLACHVTGTKRWDIPKGHFDSAIDSDYRDCAIRELWEETNIELIRDQLEEYGKHEYTKKKDLFLFLYEPIYIPYLMAGEDLKCNSLITVNGKEIPETDGFKRVFFSEIEEYFTSSMSKCILDVLKESEIYEK